MLRLTETIESAWDSKMFHVIPHSSGYDSRIISGILTKLRKRNGDSWLGDLLFLCLQPEGELFKRIMRFEGWEPSQYVVFKEGDPATDYYRDLVDFQKCWRWANDATPPVASLGLAIETLRQNGIINEAESNIQVISGSFGNEVFEKKFNVNNFLHKYYYHRYSAAFSPLLYGGFLQPFLCSDILRIVTKNSTVVPNIRTLILSEISPHLLKLEKYNDSNNRLGVRNPYRKLSDATRKTVNKNYHNSWYARNVHPKVHQEPPSIIFTQPWWSTYTAASLCEHLISHGIMITPEKDRYFLHRMKLK